jgi:hypothetical protein
MKTTRLKPQQGFAKLKGYDIEYFIQKLSVLLGRTRPATATNAEGTPAATPAKKGGVKSQEQQAKQLHKDQEVDIPLGEHKNISRKHAKIEYNFNNKQFELFVLGKNPVKVDGLSYSKKSQPVILHNGSEILIGDSFFIFLLPTTNTGALQQHQQIQHTEQPVTNSMAYDDGATGAPIFQQPTLQQNKQLYEKPALSYATMIAQALSSQPNKRLTLQGIYQWIMDNYPYYQNAEVGWRSSVRHNLSLNKFFSKVPQEETEQGKRAVYALNPEYEEDLLKGLTGRKLSKHLRDKEKPETDMDDGRRRMVATPTQRKGTKRKASNTDDDDQPDEKIQRTGMHQDANQFMNAMAFNAMGVNNLQRLATLGFPNNQTNAPIPPPTLAFPLQLINPIQFGAPGGQQQLQQLQQLQQYHNIQQQQQPPNSGGNQ